MPFIQAIIIGGALAGAGAGMNAMGSAQQEAALMAVKRQAIRRFRTLGNEYRDLLNPIIVQYSKEREENMGLYRTEMNRAITDFTRYFDQARTEYGAGMERALGEMRTGRESTIELSRQQTQRQQQAAAARNAFTGLGQTSFGQGRLEAIGRQGVLQEGAIREQYAGQLSALEAQRAAGMSTLSAQMGQGISGMQQMLATNLSNMYQTYSGNIANMQQQGLGQQFNIYQQGLNIGFGAQMQAANLAGAGVSAFGSALGSVGGSLMGAGFGGMMAPAGAATGAATGAAGNAAGYPQFNMPPPASWSTQGYGYGGYGSFRGY